MGQLHQFGKKKRVHQTSTDRNHDHIYKLGKARTRNAVYYDELDMLNGSTHHHPIFYDSVGNPDIGIADGHEHQA